MQRLNQENINTPEHFNTRFNGTVGLFDIARFEKLAKYFKPKYVGDAEYSGKYVDIGVWDSIMPALLAERYGGADIYALDYADKVVQFMGTRFPKVHYKLIQDACTLPFQDDSVDYVVGGEIIEHMEDPQKFVNECLRILKPGGYLAISTPHIEIEKKERIGGPLHLWSFDEQDLKTLMGNPEIEIHKEGENLEHLTWIAWKQK